MNAGAFAHSVRRSTRAESAATLPVIAAVRSSRSLGVGSYVDRLAGHLRDLGVDYRPCVRARRDFALHLHLANSSRTVLWQLATADSPLVTVHDVLPRTGTLMPCYRQLVYPLLARASATIVHSHFAADLLRRIGVRPARLEVIPHSVATCASLDQQEARRLLGWDEQSPLFVVAGVLKSAKLIAETLEAAAPLLERGQLRLALAGVPTSTKIVAAARSLGVFVLASPPRELYERAIIAADCVLVLRERSVGETNGPLMDALAAGRPVLATPVGSIPEIAADAALYCEPSVSDIRAGLIALCRRDERIARAESARRRAELYDGAVIAAGHQQLFQEVFDA